MKTAIYCNVTTGEAFDKDGTLRTANNPFTISYGEHHKTEWHLVSAADPDSPVSEWTPWTDWETVPSFAFAAADDNYRNAYKGTLKYAVGENDTSLAIITDAPAEEIAPAGTLRLVGSDASPVEIEYTSFSKTDDGASFTVEIPEGTSFAAGIQADIEEEPLVRSGAMIAGESNPQQSVFTLDLRASGWRLSKKMEYTDIALLEARGLELCVGGIDTGTGNDVTLFRFRVPFAIRGVICQNAARIPDPVDLSPLQQWALALFSAGVEVSYLNANNEWGSVSTGATAFRWRLSGISGMPWGPAVQLEKYDAGKQIHCEFTVEEANTLEVRIPLSGINGASGPFHCGVFQIGSGTATEITGDVSISFTGTELVISSQEALQTGDYEIIG